MYSKYRAVRTEVDGITFASKSEANYYIYLKGLEQIGTIKNLKLQTKLDVTINGKKICSYKPDFEYDDDYGHHYIDVKGFETPVFKLKKKLIEAYFGIEIEIVKG